MLYHVTFQINQQALGFAEQRERVQAAEAQSILNARASGALKGLWVRADGGGTVFVIEAQDHEALSSFLQSQPVFPFLRNVALLPVVDHPALAQ